MEILTRGSRSASHQLRRSDLQQQSSFLMFADVQVTKNIAHTIRVSGPVVDNRLQQFMKIPEA